MVNILLLIWFIYFRFMTGNFNSKIRTVFPLLKTKSYSKITFKQSWLGFHHNSLFPAHQSQTKYFRKTFRQMYLWPHQLQKTNDKKSNLCCTKKRDCSTDANLKTVRANFLTRLHRTWVWWTRTKKSYFFWKLTIGSAEALHTVREVRSVRERERERERETYRRKWRHLSRAEISDEFCTFLCQKCAP